MPRHARHRVGRWVAAFVSVRGRTVLLASTIALAFVRFSRDGMRASDFGGDLLRAWQDRNLPDRFRRHPHLGPTDRT